MIILRPTILTVVVLLVLSACKTTSLKYSLDPEFSYLKESLQTAQIVAVTVTDQRDQSAKVASEYMAVAQIEDVAETLRNQLIRQLRKQGYKIINKPLLADIAYDLVIKKLVLKVDKSLFKTSLNGNSEISLTLHKHGESKSKIFSASRTQEVANPASNLDATGVVNQMLSSLFANMFSDQSLVKFISDSE